MILRCIKLFRTTIQKAREHWQDKKSWERGEQLKQHIPIKEGWVPFQNLMPICTLQYSSWNSVFFSPACEENWLICAIGLFYSVLQFTELRPNRFSVSIVCKLVWKAPTSLSNPCSPPIYTRNPSFYISLLEKFNSVAADQFNNFWPSRKGLNFICCKNL